ncbi:hypothetical protein [Nonomuraea sp. K271]|uniref:hypothetical protein n=1 Tax=Nonomuraea sp. K271 TaxID=1848319 RepID=UPI00191BF92B
MAPAREREVLALPAQGRFNAGIATALTLGDSAVGKHIDHATVETHGSEPSVGWDGRVMH